MDLDLDSVVDVDVDLNLDYRAVIPFIVHMIIIYMDSYVCM